MGHEKSQHSFPARRRHSKDRHRRARGDSVRRIGAAMHNSHALIEDASERTSPDYAEHVNPQWQRLLSVLGMNVKYGHCSGAELFTSDGRRLIDFLSGYCVHNAGHNHPEIIAAVKEELDRCGPAMLQSHVPELAGELAARLCYNAGGNLSKVVFCSSGSEGVETAIKFARA